MSFVIRLTDDIFQQIFYISKNLINHFLKRSLYEENIFDNLFVLLSLSIIGCEGSKTRVKPFAENRKIGSQGEQDSVIGLKLEKKF